jgi:hypothetical protein
MYKTIEGTNCTKKACVEQVAIVPCAKTSPEVDGTDIIIPDAAPKNEYIISRIETPTNIR